MAWVDVANAGKAADRAIAGAVQAAVVATVRG